MVWRYTQVICYGEMGAAANQNREECSLAKALDGSEDVVGRSGPAERSGVSVVGLDVAFDGGFEFGGRAVGAALDLPFGEEREEALDLIDP